HHSLCSRQPSTALTTPTLTTTTFATCTDSSSTDMAAEQLQAVSTTAQSLATAVRSAERHRLRVNQTLDSSRDAIELVNTTFAMARDMSVAATQQIGSLESYATTIATIAAQMLHFVEQMELYAIASQNSALDSSALDLSSERPDSLSLAQQVTSTTRRLVSSAAELDPLLDKLRHEASKTSNVVSNTTQQIVSGTHLMGELQGNFNQLGDANTRIQSLLSDAIAIASEQVQSASAAHQTVSALATRSDLDVVEPAIEITDKFTTLAALAREIQTGLETLRIQPVREDSDSLS
ncbi:MAG: hypothetical protein AAFX40_15685, partial [Cyanobacteria bacterium J06639_1]